MIKAISITNFYSFRQETIKMNPNTNILIGINGSGKSNFLKVFRLLKEGVAGIGLKKYVIDNLGGFDNCFFKGFNENEAHTISIEYVFEGDKISQKNYGFRFTDDIIYRITLVKALGTSNYYIQEKIESDKGFVYLDFTNGSGHLTENVASNNKTRLVKYTDYDPQELVMREVFDTDRYFALTTLKKAIRDIVVYDYFDTTPKSPIRRPMLPISEKKLIADGTNLPQILNTIKINYKPQYRQIAAMLNEVNPNFTGFDFNFVGGNIELMLEEEKLSSAIHVSNMSDGTLRYLCLLSILYNPERGSIICIDEPEAGLHLDMVLNIANAIKVAAENSTIIISTHSADLLNYFDIENIRVFEKDENNATKVVAYTTNQFADWYENFSVGQMWKQGDLGGVRYGS
jgi:predicted ATPase